MIVELKKTKLTKSIVDQSLRGSESLMWDRNDYSILGWVMIKGMRLVLLYNHVTHQIVKLNWISDARFRSINYNQFLIDENNLKFQPMYEIYMYFSDLHGGYTIKQPEGVTEEQFKVIHQKMCEFIEIEKELEQIYL